MRLMDCAYPPTYLLGEGGAPLVGMGGGGVLVGVSCVRRGQVIKEMLNPCYQHCWGEITT